MPKSPDVDKKLGIYGFISDIHYLTHKGIVWSAGGVFQDLADDGVLNLLIRTGENEVHVTYEIDAGGDALYWGLEGVIAPTSAGVVLGTSLVPQNKYREHKADTNNVLMWVVPSLVSTGLSLYPKFVSGGQKGFAGGGEASGRNEWILDPNSDYALRIKNIAGSAKTFGATLEYYEYIAD